MNESKLDATLRALAGTTVDIKWGADRVYSVGAKMYAVYGEQHGNLSFKVPDDHFLAWTERPGVSPAPYLARAHWVLIAALETLAEAELLAALQQSWRLVAAKLSGRERQRLGILLQ